MVGVLGWDLGGVGYNNYVIHSKLLLSLHVLGPANIEPEGIAINKTKQNTGLTGFQKAGGANDGEAPATLALLIARWGCEEYVVTCENIGLHRQDPILNGIFV